MKRTSRLVAMSCLVALVCCVTGCPYIPPPPSRPTADFSASKLTGYVPFTVQFSDKSDEGDAPITEWAWDFGDGGTSTDANPSHTYTVVDIYTVSLTVTNSYGTDTKEKGNYITVRPQENPTAGFRAAPTSGLAPLTVTFEDLSTPGSGSIVSWEWNFGDDTISEQAGDVVHEYSVPGIYSVSLEIESSDDLFDRETKTNLIEVLEKPVEMVSVAGGWFRMGAPANDANVEEDEEAGHFVKLDAYEIGKYEVTNAEYCEALNWARDQGLLWSDDKDVLLGEGGPLLLGASKSSCNIELSTSGFVPKERDGHSMAEHPVVMVTWKGAAVFCNWLSAMYALTACYDDDWELITPYPDGFRLPTEAEWERAAGWDTTRTDIPYPDFSGSGYLWHYAVSADALTTVLANFDQVNPLDLTSVPYTTPVGSYTGSASPAGCYDMSGNAREWVYDRYAPSYSSANQTNPTGPEWTALNPNHVWRGGDWSSPMVDCRTANRYQASELYSPYAGFRIAWTPSQQGKTAARLFETLARKASDATGE